MTELEIIEELKRIFTLVMNRNADLSNITRDSKLIEDLGVNSIGLVYLAVAVEETFDVDMSSVTFNSFKTVGDVIDYIKR